MVGYPKLLDDYWERERLGPFMECSNFWGVYPRDRSSSYVFLGTGMAWHTLDVQGLLRAEAKLWDSTHSPIRELLSAQHDRIRKIPNNLLIFVEDKIRLTPLSSIQSSYASGTELHSYSSQRVDRFPGDHWLLSPPCTQTKTDLLQVASPEDPYTPDRQ